MTASALKPLSPNTRPVGPGKINRCVTMPDRAEAIIVDMARDAHTSVNELLRQLIVAGAATTKSARALALKAAMRAQRPLVLVFALVLPFLSFEARRPRSNVSRSVAFPIRRQEVVS